jgi:hypothetical protein
MELKKELNAFEFLPKIIPMLDMIFILWVALNSPDVWVTTPIHLSMPVVGLTALYVFKDKGRLGFYLVGLSLGVPIFVLNLWGSANTPTWLAEFAFLAGGLLLTKSVTDRLAVLLVVLVTTVLPLYLNNNSWRFITTIVIAEVAVWFLLDRSFRFMQMQQSLIEQQKHLVEEKQREIIESMHYAKRIQQALLPNEKSIAKTLNRS